MSTGGVGGGVGGGPSNGAGNEAPLSLPQSGTTLCPYASSAYYQVQFRDESYLWRLNHPFNMISMKYCS
jgi:hypothetical protein